MPRAPQAVQIRIPESRSHMTISELHLNLETSSTWSAGLFLFEEMENSFGEIGLRLNLSSIDQEEIDGQVSEHVKCEATLPQREHVSRNGARKSNPVSVDHELGKWRFRAVR